MWASIANCWGTALKHVKMFLGIKWLDKVVTWQEKASEQPLEATGSQFQDWVPGSQECIFGELLNWILFFFFFWGNQESSLLPCHQKREEWMGLGNVMKWKVKTNKQTTFRTQGKGDILWETFLRSLSHLPSWRDELPSVMCKHSSVFSTAWASVLLLQFDYPQIKLSCLLSILWAH